MLSKCSQRAKPTIRSASAATPAKGLWILSLLVMLQMETFIAKAAMPSHLEPKVMDLDVEQDSCNVETCKSQSDHILRLESSQILRRKNLIF